MLAQIKLLKGSTKMLYVLVVISIVFFVINAVSLKLFQQKVQKSETSIFLFFTVSFSLTALFSFALGGCTIPSADALIFGLFSGLFSFIVAFGSSKAYEKGSASLAAVIINMSLSIPIVYSFFAYEEKISFIQYIGLAFMLVSIVFSGISDQSGNTVQKSGLLWIVFALVAMLANGTVSVIQKEYQLVTGASDTNSMVSVSCLTTAILNLVIFLCKIGKRIDSRNKYFSSKLSFCAISIAFSLSTMIGSITLFSVNTKVPAVILYPCLNGGIALLSAIVFILLFKEKCSFTKIVSLFFGMIAIVLLAL